MPRGDHRSARLIGAERLLAGILTLDRAIPAQRSNGAAQALVAPWRHLHGVACGTDPLSSGDLLARNVKHLRSKVE
jgi:hypothetical protein